MAKSKKTSPADLLNEVRGQPAAKTYEFDDYVEVIHELQCKGFSYAKIAAFLTERLGYQITRGQVYRAYQIWLEQKERVEEEEQRQRELEQMLGEGDQPCYDPEAEEAERVMGDAAGKLLRWSIEQFPDESLPESRVMLFKRVIAFLDDKQRDDMAAERADREAGRGD